MSNSESKIDSREFMSRSAVAIGGVALANSALSYGRILGANDRISLCHIGNGSRGEDLDWVIAQIAEEQNGSSACARASSHTQRSTMALHIPSQ